MTSRGPPTRVAHTSLARHRLAQGLAEGLDEGRKKHEVARQASERPARGNPPDVAPTRPLPESPGSGPSNEREVSVLESLERLDEAAHGLALLE